MPSRRSIVCRRLRISAAITTLRVMRRCRRSTTCVLALLDKLPLKTVALSRHGFQVVLRPVQLDDDAQGVHTAPGATAYTPIFRLVHAADLAKVCRLILPLLPRKPSVT